MSEQICYGRPLGDATTYRLQGIDKSHCDKCPLKDAPKVGHRPFGITGRNGERKKLKQRDRLRTVYGKDPDIQQRTFCTPDKNGGAIISSNEIHEIDDISRIIPCLKQSDTVYPQSNFQPQPTGFAESRRPASQQEIAAALRNREP